MIYFNDSARTAAAWLRELIRERHLPEGYVDERPIQEVKCSELAGYGQCHFFAGIGGWSYALQLAGWPAARPVWTGSCPCQPFSAAGKRKGQADERHLWPVLFRLVRECRPPVVFGEQVASDDGYRWLARVRDDLETEGYAVGCADLPACSQGSPIIRQRLWWVASAKEQRCGQGDTDIEWVDSRVCEERNGRRLTDDSRTGGLASAKRSKRRKASSAGIYDSDGKEARRAQGPSLFELRGAVGWTSATASDAGFWGRCHVVHCRDGKARRFEPGSFPLSDGLPGRVGLLRGYGNAIVPQVAGHFIKAFLAVEADAVA